MPPQTKQTEKVNKYMMNNIPPVTKNLLIVNVLAFIACLLSGADPYGGYALNNVLGLHFFKATDFHLYQLFTYMFMHASWSHIFFNMFALWMFGCVIENVWGARKFLIYYLVCGLGAGFIQELVQFGEIWLQNPQVEFSHFFNLSPQEAKMLNGMTTVGASGAVYGILLAFGMIFPEERVYIMLLPVPVKAKWFVSFYIVVELFLAINSSGDGIAHFAHLGGMLFGFILIRYWSRKAYREHGHNYIGKSGQFFEKMKEFVKEHQQNTIHEEVKMPETKPKEEKKEREPDEIDLILDKIRKSGYSSLSEEERKKLFDQSHK